VLVADEHGLTETVEGAAKPDGLRARLRHGFGRPVRRSLEMAHALVHGARLTGRDVGSESGGKRAEALPEGAAAQAAADEQRDEDDENRRLPR